MASPLCTYRDATNNKTCISGAWRPFNGKEFAWISFFYEHTADHDEVLGSAHWSSNFSFRRNPFLPANTYRFMWSTMAPAPDNAAYLDFQLALNQPYHLFSSYSSGIIAVYANGLAQTGGVNATSGAILNTHTNEVLFIVGQTASAPFVPSPARFEQLAIGYGASAASIPNLAQIIQLRDRTILPTAATGVQHFWSLTGTNGADVTLADAGLVDQVGSFDFDAKSTPSPLYSGTEILFEEDKTVECRTDSVGRNLFFICRNVNDSSPCNITPWTTGTPDIRTGADVLVRIKKNGGPDITPEFIFWDQGGAFVMARLLSGDAILGSDVVTWSAPAGWLNTVNGPVYETVNEPAANRIGQAIFDLLPVEDRRLMVGQNESFQFYTRSSGPSLTNLFHHATQLRDSSNNLPIYGTIHGISDTTLPASGWTAYIGDTTQWDGMKNIIPYRFVPEGDFIVRWDGSGNISGFGETNATIVPGATNITGTTDNERIYNITRTVTNAEYMGSRWALNGSGAITNVRVFPPGIDPNSPPVWHPSFLAKMAGVKIVRFMDTFYSNGNEISDVNQWMPDGHPSYSAERYLGWSLLASVEPVANINTATNNYFVEDKNVVYMKYTTTAPHGYKLGGGQMITISYNPTAGMTFDTSEKILYHVSGIRMYVTSATTFIAAYYAGVANPDGLTSPNWVSQDPLPAGLRSYVQLQGMLPYQKAVDLCNTLGAHLWFNSPVHMTQASYETIATYVRDNLDEGLIFYSEIGNEPWNTANLFLHNDFYKCRHRELGRPGTWYEYIAEHDAMVHDWMEPIFVAGGRGADYKRVQFGWPSNVSSGTDALNWAAAHGKRVDVITPNSYWNPAQAWVNLPASYHVSAAELCDMNQVSCKYGAYVAGKNYRRIHNEHRLQYEAIFPDIEVIHYEGGYATGCYAQPSNPRRIDLSFASARHPNAYHLTNCILEELNEAGSAGHIHYVSIYADNVFDGWANFNGTDIYINYGATWGMYTYYDQKPGLGDGSVGTTDNEPIIESWRDVSGDYVVDRTDYGLMDQPGGQAYFDWNESLTAEPPPSGGWVLSDDLLEGGFEVPVLTFSSYTITPSGAWVASGAYAAISHHSIFDGNNQPVPEGNQNGVIQNTGVLTQTMTLDAGTYKLSGMFAQRFETPGQTISLKVDGVEVHTFTPTDDDWELMESDSFTIATTGSHTIALAGTVPGTGGECALVDDVKLYVGGEPSEEPTVTPASVTLDQLATATFVANDFAGTPVFSVVTSGGGSINSSTGVYTAPTHTGTINATITIQATDGTDTATATALVRPVTVTIDQTSPSVVVNQTITLTGSVTGITNTAKTWSKVSGSGTIHATSGVFTASTTAGTSVVRLTSDGNAAKFSEVTVTTTAAPATPTISPSSVTVNVNASQQFTATGFSSAVTGWQTTVGTVSSTGFFTAQGTPGTGTVSAFNASQNATASVTVVAVPAGPSIAPATATVISGGQQQFSASGFTGAVTWTVTGTSTISSTSGLFTASYNASTLATVVTVTATSGAQIASANVTIPPVTIAITPANATIPPNTLIDLTANVTNAVNQGGTWSVQGGPGTINQSGEFTSSSILGTSLVRFTLTANSAIYKETSVVTSSTPSAKTEWYGLLPRANTTVAEARTAGSNILKLASPNVFDGPTALPSRKVIVSITRGSTDTRVCNLLISSRSGGTFTVDEAVGGPDANCLVGDWASIRWTNEHAIQLQEAINALEP